MREHRVKKQKRITAVITAAMMFLAVIVPAASAAPVNAAEQSSGNVQSQEGAAAAEKSKAEKESEVNQNAAETEKTTEKTQEKTIKTQKEATAAKSAPEGNQAKAAAAKKATKIEVVKQPEDNTVTVSVNGYLVYDFTGMQIKITYDDGTSEIAECEEGDYFYLDEIDGIGRNCNFDLSDIQEGVKSIPINYREYDVESDKLINTKSTSMAINCIAPKTVKSISAKLPENMKAYVGLDKFVFYQNMQVEITYTDGTTEVVDYFYDGSFRRPKYDPEAEIRI